MRSEERILPQHCREVARGTASWTAVGVRGLREDGSAPPFGATSTWAEWTDSRRCRRINKHLSINFYEVSDTSETSNLADVQKKTV